METLTKSLLAYITTLIPGFRRLNDRLFNAIIAGFLGFAVFLMIIFLMHIINFI